MSEFSTVIRPATAAETTVDATPSLRAGWARLLVATLARVLVLTFLGGLVWAALPTLWGWTATTVLSDSMAPSIRAGDVVVTMPVGTVPDIGRVVLVNDPDHADRLRLHRLVEVGEGLLITKGDANAQNDSSPVRMKDLVGVAVLRSPFVGLPFYWMSTGEWGLVAAVLAGLTGLIALAQIDAPLRRRAGSGDPASADDGDADSDGDGDGERFDDPLGRRVYRPRLGPDAVLGILAGVSALSLLLSNGSHAAYAATVANPTSTLAAATAYPCFPTSVPPDSPYFFHRFSENGTTALDSSANGRTSVLDAGATRAAGVGCTGNPYLTLNGTATGQLYPTATTTIAGPTTFSLEAWFRTSTTVGGKIIGFGNNRTGVSSNYDRHIYMTNPGRLTFGTYSGTTYVATSTASYNDGAWHHVVATMDGTTAGMRLYVDGVQVATNPNKLSQAFAGYWRIGRDNLASWPGTPTSQAFAGDIDSVAVYSTALSAAQVAAHFAAGR